MQLTHLANLAVIRISNVEHSRARADSAKPSPCSPRTPLSEAAQLLSDLAPGSALRLADPRLKPRPQPSLIKVVRVHDEMMSRVNDALLSTPNGEPLWTTDRQAK
jgi:hypothetical protein